MARPLTTDDIDMIAERAAEKALQKYMQKLEKRQLIVFLGGRYSYDWASCLVDGYLE